MVSHAETYCRSLYVISTRLWMVVIRRFDNPIAIRLPIHACVYLIQMQLTSGSRVVNLSSPSPLHVLHGNGLICALYSCRLIVPKGANMRTEDLCNSFN